MHVWKSFVVMVPLGSLFTSFWLMPNPAASEEARAPVKPLVKVEISASQVNWRSVGNERLTLTVAGPGGLYVQRELDAGEAPSFSALDVEDGRLLDGVYAYELRAKGGDTQWGHLWVQGGSFMDKVAAPLRPVERVGPAPEPLSKVTANATVIPAAAVLPDATVIPEDLVVQGQACIGTDCGTGDAYGPVLKIKEEGNYQIKFEGLNCCYPSEHVWAIQANDKAGHNGDFTIRDLTYGNIPFRIAPNAPDNSFTISAGNGNIGVGTLTPAVRLDVKANAAGQAAARLQSSSATGHSGIQYLDSAGDVDLYFGIDNAASATHLDSVNNNPIVILTNSAERVRITSAILSVASGEVQIPGGTASANGWPTHFNWADDGRNYIRGTTLIADDGGSVGIGTQAPASKLHVHGGDIRVSGGSFIDDGATLDVPDYVFEAGYRLLPLDELREFIAREKHLPNVPSAEDVKREGLNLGQVQMRLLEKLEELTLYTLTQDEEIKALRARLEELEKANAAEQQ